jgi:hypothetical protein
LRRYQVGIGFSLFLFVVGAILTFAVEVRTSGFSLNTVGIILIVGGLLGLLFPRCSGAAFRPGAGAGPWPAGTGWWRSAGSSESSRTRTPQEPSHQASGAALGRRLSIDVARRRIRDASSQC